MIGGEGVIGKIVLFIVNKTIGKLIGLPFDKRKKACRSLIKLYYCVQTLDDVTDIFFQSFEDFEDMDEANAMVHALNNNMREISLASNMFVELGGELSAGLEIIDPVLANCCHSLYISKADFLTFMSNSISWTDVDGVRCIKIKVVNDKMINSDIDSTYEMLSLKDDDKVFWPDMALHEYENNTTEMYISFTDLESAKKLKEKLQVHSLILKEAKESLRNLLKDNFSIEEVLFQNDSHPWRNP